MQPPIYVFIAPLYLPNTFIALAPEHKSRGISSLGFEEEVGLGNRLSFTRVRKNQRRKEIPISMKVQKANFSNL